LRNLILILILAFSAQKISAQACGIYRINYVGEFVTQTESIKKIKLPTIMYLHNLEKEDSELAFVETDLIEGKIDAKIRSQLTSHLYSKAEYLKEFYKSKRKGFPIILFLKNNGKTTEKIIEISWDKAELKMVDDDGFGDLFQIDLGKVAWE
tara:strand:- start:95 stop:550 length:456 start_codon:yes stop_codon:yes gene_type:complete